MEPFPKFDLYLELEVAPTASQETIEAAFRSLAKRYHPDVAANASEAAAKMKRLNVARDVLADPNRRAEYDRHRAVGEAARPGSPKPPGDTSRAAPPRGAQRTRRPRRPDGPPTCPACGEAFASAGGLGFHMRFSGCKP
jgi:curved DNA-binding protein